LSESKDGIISQNVSRRSVLKWSGALAAAGIVGIGLGVGGDLLLRPNVTKTTTSTSTATGPKTTVTTTASGTNVTTTVTPPPTTISQSQMSTIIQQLIAQHSNMTVAYSGIPHVENVVEPVKLYISNNVIQSIVPGDDTIHPNIAREDSVMSSNDLIAGHLQSRGAANIYTFGNFIQSPERILYPMQRVSARGQPNGQFVRVSWEEALDAIGAEYLQLQNQYGVYFHQTGFPLLYNMGNFLEGFFSQQAGPWGNVSLGSHHFASGEWYPVVGVYGGDVVNGNIADIFNSKLIVYWGHDPTVGNWGGYYPSLSFYYRLAKEKGIPSISIDPVHTMTANNLCDQWIPIRPGTDLAMMCAVAYVLFNENLYDTDYVSKFVEPTGFAAWQSYILGNTAGPDGAIARTPEWAAPICGVPADTIKNFAEVYAASKPVFLQIGWGPGREFQGDMAVRAAIYLQAMTGNIGIPGGADPVAQYWFNSPVTVGYPLPAYGSNPNTSLYSPPLMKDFKIWDAILMRDDYQNGKITQEEYFQTIGNAAGNPAPNVHMLLWMTNIANIYPNVNKALQAIQAIDMLVVVAYFNTPSAQLADYILPQTAYLEAMGSSYASLSITSPFDPMEHGVIYNNRVLTPPGETMDYEWIATQIVKRIGNVSDFMPKYTTDAEWDSMMDSADEAGFNAYSQSVSGSNGIGGTLPDWDTFKKRPYIYADGVIQVPWYDQINNGTAFPTKSGKMEFYSNYAATTDLTQTQFGPFLPMAMWDVQPQGMFDTPAAQYPLELISVHTRQTNHALDGGNKDLLGEVYVHRLWINPSDAAQRGIVDNDPVIIYNDLGQVVENAYVTSRIAPGVLMSRHGVWYSPNAQGIDTGGEVNVVTVDGFNADGQEGHNMLVQVAKFNGYPPGAVSTTTTTGGST
jgi:anaerobic dimethyl sulfoxide reductase subunit A